MELWIRSQDRTLLEKAIMIKIAHLHNESINEEDFTYSIIVNNDYVFADYKTKERALEVLDEIHNRIATLTTISLMGVNDTNLKVFNKYLKENPCSVVYEMPKE